MTVTKAPPTNPNNLRDVPTTHTETDWAGHARTVLQRAGHHRGAARDKLIDLLGRHDCALSALEIEDALHERDMGEFKGEPYDSMLAHSAFDPARPWLWKPPHGESFEDVKRRTAPVLDRLAIEHSGREVIVVSHGGVMMSLWAHVTGNWEGATVVPNCGIVLIEHAEGRYHPPKFIED